MMDPNIKTNIEHLKSHIEEINKLITELTHKGVEIQLTYDNNMNGKGNTTPSLQLWRAIEKVDYL
jgi:hypothetical protein